MALGEWMLPQTCEGRSLMMLIDDHEHSITGLCGCTTTGLGARHASNHDVSNAQCKFATCSILVMTIWQVNQRCFPPVDMDIFMANK
jgi:hypothetical protein